MSEKTNGQKTMSVPELNAQLAKRAKVARNALLGVDSEYSNIIDLYEEALLALDADNVRLREVAKKLSDELGEIKEKHEEEDIKSIIKKTYSSNRKYMPNGECGAPCLYKVIEKGSHGIDSDLCIENPDRKCLALEKLQEEVKSSPLLSGKIDVDIPRPEVVITPSAGAKKTFKEQIADKKLGKKDSDGQSTEKSNA